MKVKILNHEEIEKGVKRVDAIDIFTKKPLSLTLSGESYKNFVKYIMYLWSGNQTSKDVVTKVIKNGGYYFYKV